MKKFLIISLTILFSISLSIFIFLEFKNSSLKRENKEIKKEISIVSNNNNLIKEENDEYEEKINSLKVEKESIIKEVNIWKETKEKIEKALS